MKVVIVTCLNERPDVSRILMMCAKRLGVYLVASVHNEADKSLVEECGFTAVMCPINAPGLKWNTALRQAVKTDATHFLIMGDDDSISTEGFNMLVSAASSGEHYVGFKSCGFYHLRDGSAMMFDYSYKTCNKLIGAGRLISRHAVDHVCQTTSIVIKKSDIRLGLIAGDVREFRYDVSEYLVCMGYARQCESKTTMLWPDSARSGLDGHSEIRMVMNGFMPFVVGDDKIHVSDFKSQRNIWKFGDLVGHSEKCLGPDLTWFLSPEELSYVHSLSGV